MEHGIEEALREVRERLARAEAHRAPETPETDAQRAARLRGHAWPEAKAIARRFGLEASEIEGLAERAAPSRDDAARAWFAAAERPFAENPAAEHEDQP